MHYQFRTMKAILILFAVDSRVPRMKMPEPSSLFGKEISSNYVNGKKPLIWYLLSNVANLSQFLR